MTTEVRPVTKSEWVSWRSHPVTRQFLIQINEWKENKVAEVFTGRTSTEREDMTVIGEVRGIERAMIIAAEELDCIEDDTSD